MTAPAPARGWMSAAACVDYPQDWWFATSGRDRDRARSICVECPVRIQCLNYALELGERHGIWGGVTEHARRSMRLRRRYQLRTIR